MTDFKLHTAALFGGFRVVIGEAPVGASRTFIFTEEITADQMSMSAIFCSEFNYLGVILKPGMMTTSIPPRPIGSHTFAPVSQERSSFYINAMRTPWGGALWKSNPPVETKRVELTAGTEYVSEHKSAVMLAVGSLRVKGPLTVRDVSAPAILDCRFCADNFTALTDVVFCEVWV